MASVRWEEEEEVDEEEEEGTQSRKPTHNNKRNVKCQVHQIKQTAGRISSRAPGVCAFHLAAEPAEETLWDSDMYIRHECTLDLCTVNIGIE
jgi:hypothetical protein